MSNWTSRHIVLFASVDNKDFTDFFNFCLEISSRTVEGFTYRFYI